MESWLQLMLNWDPEQRGGGLDPETNCPKCFLIMDHILNLKVSVVLMGSVETFQRTGIVLNTAKL